MNVPRSAREGTLLANGEVLVAGGFNGTVLTDAERYNPTTGGWTPTGSMLVARTSHTQTLLANGDMLVAGGLDDTEIPEAELYDGRRDLETDRLVERCPVGAAAVRLQNGKFSLRGQNSFSGLATAEL
jgi:hypothetical protein